MKSPHAMLDWIKEHTVPLAKAKKMSEEELAGKFITGEFVDIEKPEFTDSYYKLCESLKGE